MGIGLNNQDASEFKDIIRYSVVSNISKPVDVSAKFVYNFFVPDERSPNEEETIVPGIARFDGTGIQNSVDPVTNQRMIVDNDGKLVDEMTLNAATPRYVEINFRPSGDTGDVLKIDTSLESLDAAGLINYAEDLSSPIDLEFKFVDLFMTRRLKTKLALLGTAHGIPSTSHDERSEKAQSKLNRAVSFTQHTKDLMNVNEPPAVLGMNVVGGLKQAEAFKEASAMMLEMSIDRRAFWETVESDFSRNYFSRKKLMDWAEGDLINLPDLPHDDSNYVGEPVTKTMIVDTENNIDDDVFYGLPMAGKFTAGSKTNLVGYILTRYKSDSLTGFSTLDDNAPDKKVYVDSPSSTSVIDTSVRYGGSYFYGVRAVYERQFFDYDSATKTKQVQKLYVTSRPSDLVYVESVEKTPPLPPDGVFYRFNYGKARGLMITWQYPVGRQRDTKYFQIFRRKTINEPFTCIAELDFNNANPKSEKGETVRPDRIIKTASVRTFYEDSTFVRGSQYIYAVAAVDAHGLTSGYSAQSHVKFNITSNQLELKSISRAGAPKQYPNFHVDPDMDENTFVHTLTQDVMRVSQDATHSKKQIKIYLDVDAVLATNKADAGTNSEWSYENDKQILRLSDGDKANGSGKGVYKFYLMNLDRTKSDTIEIRVKDYRGWDMLGSLA